MHAGGLTWLSVQRSSFSLGLPGIAQLSTVDNMGPLGKESGAQGAIRDAVETSPCA